MSSYYINAPRQFTPMELRADKTNTMTRTSFESTQLMATAPLPVAVDTTHQSKHANLQHTHPNTYAMLRKAEAAKMAASSGVPSP